MKKYKYIIGIVLSLFVVTSISAQRVSNDNEDGVNRVDRMSSRAFVPGEVLVKFKDSSPVQVRRARGQYQSTNQTSLNFVLQEFSAQDMEQLLPKQNPKRTMRRAKAYNGETIVEKDLSQLYSIRIQSQRPDSTLQLIEKLKALPEVEYAEPNFKAYIMGEPVEGDAICSNPSQNPLYSQQWGPAFCGVDKLWTKPIVNAKRPIIAILDTGVDVTHPDLAENIWQNSAEAEGETGYDDDNDGFVDDVNGWDFVNNSPKLADYNSHGTHVAGIAAAADNGIGIVGANPMALIMPITVMQSDGSGDVRTIVKGIEYAVEHGATVINMSFGMLTLSQALSEALGYAYQSAVLVAAAGNNGKDIYYEVTYPAAHSFVLGVEAIDNDGHRGSFSNYDPDGPVFSEIKTGIDPEGLNYELKAPGVDILSTVPNGNYKKMNGTSMAVPLIAGAVSVLQMVKDYGSQELLWADLLHSDNNMETAYNTNTRKPELDLVSLTWKDSDGNIADAMELDAGKNYIIYPTIRTTFGEASNIKLHLEVGEYEDASLIDVLSNDVNFGYHLNSFASATSRTPLEVRISSIGSDSRKIRLLFSIDCDDIDNPLKREVVVNISNMVKFGGLIDKDSTLKAMHKYHVISNVAIPEGVTLTIEPGTRLEFDNYVGISVFGNIKAKGVPGKPIVFTTHKEPTWYQERWTGLTRLQWDGTQYTNYINSYYNDTLSYCVFQNSGKILSYTEDCVYDNVDINTLPSDLFGKRGNVIHSNGFNNNWYPITDPHYLFYNIVNNNGLSYKGGGVARWSGIFSSNFFNNISESFTDGPNGYVYGLGYLIGIQTDEPYTDSSDYPSYLGTSKESTIRPYVWEVGNSSLTLGSVDLSNMLTEPVREAHGIVWKVVVNGYDAQDEYEQLPPLGVGKHKFEVYFNRPMNKAVAPQISFGVRDPYTQHAVNEDGSWNEDGTIYTAYFTITAKTGSDGVNRIHVYGAEDNEFFEIPYEKTRFNINIQAAGALASGFMATPGMGRVTLSWDNTNNDFEDAIGFNVYRIFERDVLQKPRDEYGNEIWEWDFETNDWRMEIVQIPDTIRLNKEILDIAAETYIDYDVEPGKSYTYYYKVLSTDLKEYDISNIVSATPLTSTRGDANGSGDVDVADVVTIVGYVTGQEPKPFIFEAADMNTDEQINIHDVVSIIQAILNPTAAHEAMIESSAVYTIENGVLYVESPVALAGVQVQLTLSEECRVKSIEFAPAEDLKGFECASAWLSDNDYLFLAYSMSGKTLSAGKHALLYVGDAQVNTLRLSDVNGRNVVAEAGNTTTGVSRMGRDVMNVKGIYDLQGRKLSTLSSQFSTLQKGIYIVNGEKVVK